jgi:hypothetical protein
LFLATVWFSTTLAFLVMCEGIGLTLGVFRADNIVIIGVLVAAFVGYTAYMQRQGKSIKTS